MKDTESEDPSMDKVRALYDAAKKDGMTMAQLGMKMGYPSEMARQSVFQFLKSLDPRISTLRRFAKAMGVPLSDLIAEKKSRK
jgi:transcriptional regulator with XRE-family HTH domain